jgi:hypothetical protein
LAKAFRLRRPKPKLKKRQPVSLKIPGTFGSAMNAARENRLVGCLTKASARNVPRLATGSCTEILDSVTRARPTAFSRAIRLQGRAVRF